MVKQLELYASRCNSSTVESRSGRKKEKTTEIFCCFITKNRKSAKMQYVRVAIIRQLSKLVREESLPGELRSLTGKERLLLWARENHMNVSKSHLNIKDNSIRSIIAYEFFTSKMGELYDIFLEVLFNNGDQILEVLNLQMTHDSNIQELKRALESDYFKGKTDSKNLENTLSQKKLVSFNESEFEIGARILEGEHSTFNKLEFEDGAGITFDESEYDYLSPLLN